MFRARPKCNGLEFAGGDRTHALPREARRIPRHNSRIKTGTVRAFLSEVDTGSREKNASKQQSRASVLIQSEPIML
jgi:hypothetical protein